MSDKNPFGNPITSEPWRRAGDRPRDHAHDVGRVEPHRRRHGNARYPNDRLRALRDSRAAGRRIIASDGMQWWVYELDLRADREGASLVFESESVVRRLRVFPLDWRELSDATLADLCQDR